MKRPLLWLLVLGGVAALLGLNRKKMPVPTPPEKRTEKIDITAQVEAFEAGAQKTGEGHP